MYYQAVYLTFEWCLPRNYGDMQSQILISQNVLDFSLLYYDFIPAVISLLFPIIMQACMSVIHYGEEVNAVFFADVIGGTLWQMTNFLLIHFVITSVGLLFVSSEMTREGNEDILNNLKESVILAETGTGKIVFANTSAKRLNKHLVEELSVSLYDQGADGPDFSIFDR